MSGAAHLHHRLAREEYAAVGYRADRSGESHLREMREKLRLENLQRLQIRDRGRIEVEILEQFRSTRSRPAAIM